MFIVYQTTNNVNKKMYVGVHYCESAEFDGYFGSGIALKRAIKKYGKENFTREILHVCSSLEEAYALEAKLVDINFVNRHDVYNAIPGGRGGRGRRFSEESRAKMSASAKIRIARDGSPTRNGQSEATKRKVSETRKARGIAAGAKKPKARSVTIKGKCFATVNEAAKHFGVVPKTIRCWERSRI